MEKKDGFTKMLCRIPAVKKIIQACCKLKCHINNDENTKTEQAPVKKFN